MSLDAYLIHTCTIENEKIGALDTHNNEVKAWNTPIENVRCRFVETTENIESNERAEGVVHSVYKLMVFAGVDLNDKAKISKLTLEDGTVIHATFLVTGPPLTRRGRNSRHKTATLERLS